MKKTIFLVIALALLLALQPLQNVPAQSVQKMAIPSYFYPGAYWTQLINGAPTVGLAIINPASGPGKKADSNYLNTVRQAQARGITVLGYVYTKYGSRRASAVRADIDKYYSWYRVDGIFFDEASTDCAKLSYYQGLYNYVKAKGGQAKVVLNPGINTGECYVNASDILVNFEDNFAAYTTWSPSGWEYNYPAERFWHLVLGASKADMTQAIAWSKQRHAGWVYVTNDNLPNPWDTLPFDPYWSNELNAINQP
jgi:hypothetical protein